MPGVLLCLRLSVFLVILVRALDKFLRPAHRAVVFDHFCFIGEVTKGMLVAIGIIELILILAFVAGFAKPST